MSEKWIQQVVNGRLIYVRIDEMGGSAADTRAVSSPSVGAGNLDFETMLWSSSLSVLLSDDAPVKVAQQPTIPKAADRDHYGYYYRKDLGKWVPARSDSGAVVEFKNPAPEEKPLESPTIDPIDFVSGGVVKKGGSLLLGWLL
uniref:Uncharacterized protein n=1 Tax=viral metagenome TaxID=1070528 RepID=A0A2V0RIA7_9ZZZZ